MKTRKQDFALGLATILFVALFVGTVLFLAPPLRVATRNILVYFPQEEGLAPIKAGSLVLLSGAVEVGHVTKVEPREIVVPPPRHPARRLVIAVEAQVDKSVPLYGNCAITTDMPLVGGSGTMVITNVGTPDVPLTGEPIDGLPAQGMAALGTISRRLGGENGVLDRLDRMLDPNAEGSLLNKVTLSVADVNAMTKELRTQLGVAEPETVLGRIRLILEDLHVTTGAVREQAQVDNGASLMAKVHAALDVIQRDLSELLAMLTENRPLVRGALTSVEHTARTIDEDVVGKLKTELDQGNPASVLGKLHTAMDRVNASLADLQVVSETGKRLLVLNRPEVEAILANVKDMSEELTLTSKELRLNPSRLIWGPGSPQKGKTDVFMAAREFAQAATFLDDAAARLQAVMQLTPAGGRVPESDVEVQKIYEALRAAFERFERAETFFWEQMK